ncbi:MAG: lipid II flippase MurJ [Ilumatobacteraceae bacterium]
MSITTTFVPELARLVARKDRDGFVNRASLGIRLVALLTFPASAALFALRRPIVGLLFAHGKFTAADALVTSRALGGFAIGLIGFSVYLFVLRGFYAHQDTRTPFVINLVECILNVIFAIVLVGRYGVLGLGLAFGLAYLVCAVWALQILNFKVPGFAMRSLFGDLARMLLAAIVGGEIMWFVMRAVPTTNDGLAALVRLIPAGTIGIAAYLALLKALAIPELDDLTRLVRRRRRA